MKISRKKNFIEKVFRVFLGGLISLSTIFGNVKNIQAESFTRVNFPKESIIEHLKLDVPKEFKNAWLKAEEGRWEPWLLKKDGFLGRQLFWNPKDEEATLLIGWKSRDLWKSIPQSEINFVQQEFENIARKETAEIRGNPFTLIYEGELIPE